MQVSASPVSGFAPPLFPPLDEADHDAADQQGASGNDSANGNDGDASARHSKEWWSNLGPPSSIAAQIRAQTSSCTQQNSPSTQTQTAQASPADKSSPALGTQHADASGATATSANTAERDNPQAADETGQASIEPSQGYLADLEGIAKSDQSVGDKLKMAWDTTKDYWRNSNTAQGATQIVNGTLEAAGGLVLTGASDGLAAGIGVPVAVHGADTIGAGIDRIWYGGDGQTATYKGVKALTGSPEVADAVDRGIPFMGGVAGAGVAVTALTGETAAGGAAGTAAREETTVSPTVGGARNLTPPWPIQNPEPLPSFIQSGETTCGQACAASMAQSMGYTNVTEQTLIEAVGTGETSEGTLANAIENLTGQSMEGGTVDFDQSSLTSIQMRSLINNLTEKGRQPIMTILYSPWQTSKDVAHWVMVDGLDAAGNIMIRDPVGLKYTMMPSDFTGSWKFGSLVKVSK